MKKRIKNLSSLILIVGLVFMLFGITYAFFDYTFFSNSITFNAGEAYLKMLSDSSSLFTENAFPESREEALEKEDNYIDFQVIGKNQNKDKKIWYRLSIINDTVNGSYKIPDEYIAFDLIDTTDPLYPIEIIKNGRLSDYKQNGIYVDFLDEYVNSDVTKTRSFRVRIWIAEEMIISDTVAGAAFSATKREYYEPSYVFPNSELPAYSEANSILKIECYARDEEIETPFAYMKYATIDQENDFSMEFLGRDLFSDEMIEKYNNTTTLFPMDYYLSDGVTKNPNSFIKYSNRIKYVYFEQVTKEELEELKDDNNTDVLYKYDLTDYDKSSKEVWLFIKNERNGATNTVSNIEEIAKEVLIVSESIISFPIDSSNMFNWFFYKSNFKEVVIDPAIDAGVTALLNSNSSYYTNLGYNKQSMMDAIYHNINTFPFDEGDREVFDTAFNPVYDDLLSRTDELEDTSDCTTLPDGVNEVPSGYKLNNLNEIFFNNVYTGQVENMDAMFMALIALKNLDVSMFNTKNLKSMNGIFSGANSSTTPNYNADVDLSSWDTKNVVDMGWVFCQTVFHFQGFENWNVEKVKDMTGMFNMYSPHKGTQSVDLVISNWKTKSLKKICGKTIMGDYIGTND